MRSRVWPSVTWPFDSRGSTFYPWSIVTMRLSGTVTEIWCLKYWMHGRGHEKKDERMERKRGRGGKGKGKGKRKWKGKGKGKGKRKWKEDSLRKVGRTNARTDTQLDSIGQTIIVWRLGLTNLSKLWRIIRVTILRRSINKYNVLSAI